MPPRSSSPRHAIDISEDSGVRYLHFGSDWVQGAMRIARPWSLELEYTRDMMAGLLFRPAEQWPRQILQIGLGAGSLARFCYRHLPDSRITVVEINPQVEIIARQCFKLPDDPRRLRVETGCGAEYLLSCRQTFDAILVDGFDPKARMGALETLPFLQACRARLSERGLLAVNLLGREKGCAERVDRIRQAFDGRFIDLPPCDSGNIIAFAAGGDPVEVSFETLGERAEALRQATRLNLRPTLSRLRAALPPGTDGVKI